MGALVNQVQYDRSMDYIRTAHAEGAKLVNGGGRPINMARGFFIEPTVFKDVQPHHRLAQEEVFGPVLGVMRWRDEEDMLNIVNGLSMGLTASVWTRDLVTAHRAAMRIQAGYVWINDTSIHLPGASFGGYKQSGLGREESFQELHEFTQIKNINVSLRGSRP
jgi:betaine-aldehyde dehydrogenase